MKHHIDLFWLSHSYYIHIQTWNLVWLASGVRPHFVSTLHMYSHADSILEVDPISLFSVESYTSFWIQPISWSLTWFVYLASSQNFIFKLQYLETDLIMFWSMSGLMHIQIKQSSFTLLAWEGIHLPTLYKSLMKGTWQPIVIQAPQGWVWLVLRVTSRTHTMVGTMERLCGILYPMVEPHSNTPEPYILQAKISAKTRCR